MIKTKDLLAMSLPWPGKKCILCLAEDDLTDEHMVPVSLGGILSIKFLCKKCNSDMGRIVVPKALKDVRIAYACQALHRTIPHVTGPVLEKLPYVSEIFESKFQAKLVGSEKYELKQGTHSDGSLILNEINTESYLKNRMVKHGMSETEVMATMDRYRDAPKSELIEIGPDTVRKLPKGNLEIDFSATTLEADALALLMAYEFLALHFCENIYDESLEPIRKCIINGVTDEASCGIDPVGGERYQPFHGLFMKNGSPHIVVIILLFGWIGFQVSFPRLSYNGPRFVYTLRLEEGQHSIEVLGKDSG